MAAPDWLETLVYWWASANQFWQELSWDEWAASSGVMQPAMPLHSVQRGDTYFALCVRDDDGSIANIIPHRYVIDAGGYRRGGDDGITAEETAFEREIYIKRQLSPEEEQRHIEINEKIYRWSLPSPAIAQELLRVLPAAPSAVPTHGIRHWLAFSASGENGSLNTALLLKAVVVFGPGAHEGRLIEAVTLPWDEIIKIILRNPASIHDIPWYKWEELIAGAYRRAGFEEVILTPRSNDKGRDIIATKYGIGSIRIIDQVKAYRPGHLVTANDVRALIGVLHGDNASKGFLTTTSDFAPGIRTDPLITPFIPSRLDLIDGKALIGRLQALLR
jgi:restriction system protein